MHRESEKLSKQIFKDKMDMWPEEACPDCGGKTAESPNEVYCTKCGLVFDDRPINFGIDWDDEKDEWVWSKNKSRAGNPSKYINGNVNHTDPTSIG